MSDITQWHVGAISNNAGAFAKKLQDNLDPFYLQGAVAQTFADFIRLCDSTKNAGKIFPEVTVYNGIIERELAIVGAMKSIVEESIVEDYEGNIGLGAKERASALPQGLDSDLDKLKKWRPFFDEFVSRIEANHRSLLPPPNITFGPATGNSQVPPQQQQEK